jgi:hypothetical protein
VANVPDDATSCIIQIFLLSLGMASHWLRRYLCIPAHGLNPPPAIVTGHGRGSVHGVHLPDKSAGGNMADAPVVYIGENSPEQVAYKLFEHVRMVERMTLGHPAQGNAISAGFRVADRAWILDTYAECIKAVRGDRDNSKGGVEDERG